MIAILPRCSHWTFSACLANSKVLCPISHRDVAVGGCPRRSRNINGQLGSRLTATSPMHSWLSCCGVIFMPCMRSTPSSVASAQNSSSRRRSSLPSTSYPPFVCAYPPREDVILLQVPRSPWSPSTTSWAIRSRVSYPSMPHQIGGHKVRSAQSVKRNQTSRECSTEVCVHVLTVIFLSPSGNNLRSMA